MGGIQYGSVWVGDANRGTGGDELVKDMGSDGAKTCEAAAVCNGKRIMG